jgi:O-antigen ligase
MGHKILLIILGGLGMLSLSRSVSIPVKITIVITLLSALFIGLKKFRKQSSILFAYISLMIIILYRIFIDDINNNYVFYYLSSSEMILYFLSSSVFLFLPTLLINFSNKSLFIIFKSLILSGFVFNVLVIIYYNEFVGQVGRLTSTTAMSEEILSPLILSYCSALSLGLSIIFLLMNKPRGIFRVLLIATVVTGAFPFLLGSSRGSLVALIISLFLIPLVTSSLKRRIGIVILGILFIVGLYYTAEYFGSSLFDRVESTQVKVESGDEERLLIYERSFNQFLSNPLFGDTFKTQGYDNYPHNIFLEILQATGLIGFMLFLFLMISGFLKALRIIRNQPSLTWVSVLFIQSAVFNSFSGSVISATWLWLSLALVLQVNINTYDSGKN